MAIICLRKWDRSRPLPRCRTIRFHHTTRTIIPLREAKVLSYRAHVRRNLDTMPRTLMILRPTQIRTEERGMEHLRKGSPPPPRLLIMERLSDDN